MISLSDLSTNLYIHTYITCKTYISSELDLHIIDQTMKTNVTYSSNKTAGITEI